MNFTIFGYPRTGKTTLFNLLTGADIEILGYDTGRKEPNLRTCPVPDQRLDGIAGLYPDREKKPAVIDYIDLAGMAYGEIKQAGYLDHLRRADGLAHVVRGFRDESIPHPRGRVDPASDMTAMEEEILLADLVSVEARLEKLARELKGRGAPEAEKEQALMERLRAALEDGSPLREIELAPADDKLCRSFAFLSLRPLFHLINLDEAEIDRIEGAAVMDPEPRPGVSVMAFCGKIEMEIQQLDEKEKPLFMQEYGLTQLSAPRFLKASYSLLNLITFFTIGKGEVKAWTIPHGTPALEAAGEIHSDIRQGFIRAEVISWDGLLEHGSFAAARDAGAVRLEGKEYPVGDGDVIFFRFNK